MNQDPRSQDEYSGRQTEAAHRVLIDLGQVLASFTDSIVLIGGWVPDLLIQNASEPHVGSIDVDLALNVEKLAEGRYAKLIETLLSTGRYHQAEEPFKLYTMVDLTDGEQEILVDVDFLIPKGAKLTKNKPKLLPGFRPLNADGCSAAFQSPKSIRLAGKMINGAKNTVQFQVASIEGFLVMKSYGMKGRDKPKDAYDICYCLDYYPRGMDELADLWKTKGQEKSIQEAKGILTEKFSSVDDFGPQQVVEFYNPATKEEKEQISRRAFELLKKFLNLLR